MVTDLTKEGYDTAIAKRREQLGETPLAGAFAPPPDGTAVGRGAGKVGSEATEGDDEANLNRAAELGLGIYEEPGVEQVDFSGAKGAIENLVERLAGTMGDGRHIVLLNNLGGTSSLEMAVLACEPCRPPSPIASVTSSAR
jgi:triose/dihydroxyacetone kinase / FAD-AMP lyase (cyclizing)